MKFRAPNLTHPSIDRELNSLSNEYLFVRVHLEAVYKYTGLRGKGGGEGESYYFFFSHPTNLIPFESPFYGESKSWPDHIRK